MDLANAFYDSCVLFTASDLGVFAVVDKLGSADADAIAAACDLDPRGAQLLLNACVALGLLAKNGNTYSNTPESATFLVPGRPADLSGALRYNRDVLPAWTRLKEFAKTGKPVERPEIHLGESPERTRAFVMAMHSRGMAIGRAVIPHLDLNTCRHLLDVGGGSGAFSILVAKAHPGIRCTVVDLPEIVEVSRELIAEAGLSSRIRCEAANYHTFEFPRNLDVVHLFGMLHQESPDDIRDLLRRSYAALVPGGRVHMLDMMTDATHCQPKFSALFAVNMALTTQNGWVFSSDELQDWARAAGFAGFQCNPLPPPLPHWLATAVKRS
jgi:SAM-dependent methyltransferase